VEETSAGTLGKPGRLLEGFDGGGLLALIAVEDEAEIEGGDAACEVVGVPGGVDGLAKEQKRFGVLAALAVDAGEFHKRFDAKLGLFAGRGGCFAIVAFGGGIVGVLLFGEAAAEIRDPALGVRRGLHGFDGPSGGLVIAGGEQYAALQGAELPRDGIVARVVECGTDQLEGGGVVTLAIGSGGLPKQFIRGCAGAGGRERGQQDYG
jgi:hypothetical protein